MWFGGSKGVLVVDPQRFRPWDYAPPVVLTALHVDGVATAPGPPGEPVVVAPAQRQLAVEFAALDYSAPDRLHYRYRLHGYDPAWIKASAGSRLASYGNLWPGDYTLEVQGSNRRGVFAADPLRLPIRVLPAFWQTPAFVVLCGLILLLAAQATLRWRSKRADRNAQRLQLLVDQRTGELREAKEDAESALADLQRTQQQLVAAEKMASLGQLVAGVAHEVNTPLGIALTAASHLQDLNADQERRVAEGRLRRGDFNQWREALSEGMQLILGSLERAHTLIASFKQVAVDQSSEHRRQVRLPQFLSEVRFALQPSFRRAGHTLVIKCPEHIELDSYPGALFQILTNLIANSQLHGYADGEHGVLHIDVEEDGDEVILDYRDDGRGMPAEVAAQAFEPFFTTRRGSGGSGLGLHLVYNLTTQLLGGSISLLSAPGAGCVVQLRIPRHAPRHGSDPTEPG
jgi:signal transduction histidine kinase